MSSELRGRWELGAEEGGVGDGVLLVGEKKVDVFERYFGVGAELFYGEQVVGSFAELYFYFVVQPSGGLFFFACNVLYVLDIDNNSFRFGHGFVQFKKGELKGVIKLNFRNAYGFVLMCFS